MKALILAAGRGTRMQPITYTIPKPMIPILNKPVMEFLIEHLKKHSVNEVMVNTSYLSHAIEDYFTDGARFGVEIGYSFEGYVDNGQVIDEPVGSAGAIKKIQEQWGFFDETFVVLCGDAIVDVDLTQLLKIHKEKGAMATIALSEVPAQDVSSYGVVMTDDEGSVLEFQEKPSVEEAKSTMVNTGIYLFEPEVINRIPSGVNYDIGGELFPKLIAQNAKVYGANLPFQWLDMGKVSDYHHVVSQALSGQVNGLSMPGTPHSKGIHCGLNAQVDLTQSEIVPPVYIGSGSVIEPGCRIIGPTFIGQGCKVASGSHIEKSIIYDHTRISGTAHISEKIICDSYCIDTSGDAIDLKESDLEWLIADARSPISSVEEGQYEIETMLQKIGLKFPDEHLKRVAYA